MYGKNSFRCPLQVCIPSPPFLSTEMSNLCFQLYSDLDETERAVTLETFLQVLTQWNQIISSPEGNQDGSGKDEQRSHVLVVTDACLPLLASGESPISGSVLINYKLRAKKETYMRRMATCLAAGSFSDA
ncbi:Eukaryotic initiation factor 4A [Quillaja saponaria]|uniref:Eukaryotic initiation factor 4A n=1 Tax=Quillaja saponaria TaxID=32244 RepID=A0AAD7PYN1_QUISA|nr:Eukaryotic initiation factor 4A [Quillaja saponaria]